MQETNTYLASSVHFAFLPGDNASNGTPDQYTRINQTLAALTIPVYAIPGDHDFESRSLVAFGSMLGAMSLPTSLSIQGRECLFVDAVSAGRGGLDFQLGFRQRHWLEQRLNDAALREDSSPIVFMHAYPSDFPDEGAYLGSLYADTEVAIVDTGHTHYNELLNDGRVIYASTRSTGQIEEDGGSSGYSIVSVDGDVVSWRFKTLGSAWPFVVITSPSDHRLVVDRLPLQQVPHGSFEVRAKVFGSEIADVNASIDFDEVVSMRRVEGEPDVWKATLTPPAKGHAHRIHVCAKTVAGDVGADTITVLQPHAFHAMSARAARFQRSRRHRVARARILRDGAWTQ